MGFVTNTCIKTVRFSLCWAICYKCRYPECVNG